MFSVETRTVTGQVTALGSAGSFTLVVDRPVEAGGGGKGFNGGQLLYFAVAGCVSNDLFREAPRFGVELDSVRVTVEGDFSGAPALSDAIAYDVEVSGRGDLDALVREVRPHCGDTELATAGRAGLPPRDRDRLAGAVSGRLQPFQGHPPRNAAGARESRSRDRQPP
jgi:putative redox protein